MENTTLTLKNTKNEILDALNDAIARLEMAEKGKLNLEKAEREKIEKRAVENAKQDIANNIFSKELSDKFESLQIAIETEEKRLEELFGVGRKLQKLAILVESEKERAEKFNANFTLTETQAKEKLTALELEYNQKSVVLKADFAKKNADLTAEYEMWAKALKLERTREEEEYTYNLKRTRDKDNNLWEDQKAEREGNLSRQELQAKELLKQANEKIDYIEGLELKVSKISETIDEQVSLAVESTKKQLTTEFEHKAALAQKDSESVIERLRDKTQYLEKELKNAEAAIVSTQDKLDKAYLQMRDLATKTVETAGSVKIIGGNESQSKPQ